jgi:hypothetical protein
MDQEFHSKVPNTKLKLCSEAVSTNVLVYGDAFLTSRNFVGPFVLTSVY